MKTRLKMEERGGGKEGRRGEEGRKKEKLL